MKLRLRYWTLGLAVIGSAAVTAVALMKPWAGSPVPEALAAVNNWTPSALQRPSLAPEAATSETLLRSAWSQPVTNSLKSYLPPMDNAAFQALPPLTLLSRDIAIGETLGELLEEAGLSKSDQSEATLALSAEYDLRRLKPGHSLTVMSKLSGRLHSVRLNVDDGVIVEAVFADGVTVQTLQPETDIIKLASETNVKSSLSETLEQANIPPRFAVDLAQILGGTIDFRRDLKGGENLKILWNEARLEEQRIGEPEIIFAALDLGPDTYEVVWPEDGTGQAKIYVNGEILRTFAQPVEGARLSSVFGQRRHPVFGNMRMHTGVDFAAPYGTPIRATAPGRIKFIGWRGGYGRVVEIAHSSDTMTRYAHLSSVLDGVSQGQRVMAGDIIGKVGASGTATGPNLHYEVRVDGRPTDPLSDKRLASLTDETSVDAKANTHLLQARSTLQMYLDNGLPPSGYERL